VSQSKRPPPLNRESFHALYEQGEEALYAFFTEVFEEIETLKTRLTEYENRLSKNSRNSSKPPSGDGFGKRTQSLRQKSDKPSGGQIDHPGQTLEWRDEADNVIVLPVESCPNCQTALKSEPVKQIIARQVLDLPPIVLKVTPVSSRAENLSPLWAECPSPISNRGDQSSPVWFSAQRDDGLFDELPTVAE
jgi:hypothetical protein